MPTKTTTTSTPQTEEYSADQLITIDPIAYIQKKPSLSLGPHERMQLVALREPIDNAIDEYRAGHGKTVKIVIHNDGAAEIEDAGRGVPTGINSTTGENGIFMAFGRPGSGGKFGAADSGYGGTASLGTNGIGTTATNATSLRFDTTVYRNGTMYRLSFKNGKPGQFMDDSGPEAKFTPGMDIVETKDPRSAAEKKTRPSGTTIKFWPNAGIFGTDSTFRLDELREVLRSSAFLIPGLHIVIENRTQGQEQVDDYEFDGGLVDMLESFSVDKPLHKVMHFETSGGYKEITPMPQKDGSVKPEEVERRVKVDAVLQWGEGYDTNVRSYVNTIYTSLGGVHVQGLESALSKIIIDSIKATRGLITAKDKEPLSLVDVMEGLTAIVNIEQNEAKFTSQDKTKLSGAETGKVVRETLTAALRTWFADKKNDAVAKKIRERVMASYRVRIAARSQKELARKKSALESSSSLPSKLTDCETPSSEFSELFIVEGDSALGTMRAARDSRFQALLPIRGKILNVQKATTGAMLANAECANIIQVLSAGSGKTFDLAQARYSKVIIAADADVDGNHIRSLLITFFLKYMRDYIVDGRLYSLIAPLYVLTPQGKNSEKIYAIDEADRDRIRADLDKKRIKYEVGRNKGLGEMDADPAWETLMNPQNRRLKQIRLADLEAAENMVELAMGDKVPPRKEWITVNRDKISAEVFED